MQEWFTGKAFGDARSVVSPSTTPKLCAPRNSAPLPGAAQASPEDVYPLPRRWPATRQLRAQGSRRKVAQKETATGSAVGVTGGVIRTGRPHGGLLQFSADISVCPLLSTGEETEVRSPSQPSDSSMEVVDDLKGKVTGSKKELMRGRKHECCCTGEYKNIKDKGQFGSEHFHLYASETPGEPGVLPRKSLLVQGLQRLELVPALGLHLCPHPGGHLMESDVQGWQGRGLMKSSRGDVVVPSGTEGEP